MKPFEIFFLNNGMAIFQTEGYCHNYDADQIGQLVIDFKEYQQAGSTTDWDGNQPEHRVEYDYDSERNGYYYCVTETAFEIKESWANVKQFFAEVG